MKAEAVVITVTRQEQGVRLDLSLVEAQFLMDVCGRIGGSVYQSRRGISDAFMSALYAAGVRGTKYGDDFDPIRRAIYFEDSEAGRQYSEGR